MKVRKALALAVLCATAPTCAYGVSEEWVARLNTPGYGYEEASAICVASDGSVYVAGVTGRSETNRDYAVIKYDDSGAVLWVTIVDGPRGDFEGPPCALALDVDGFAYLAGARAPDDRYDSYDFLTVKLDPEGHVVWEATYDGPEPMWGTDFAQDVAVDASGSVYVTGSSYSEGTSRDCTTVKYGPGGEELWVARYDHADDWANALALDESGAVYVVGEGDAGAVIIKYDADGDELWAVLKEGAGGAEDVAVGQGGAVYVTGGAFVTAKYDSDGDEQWVATYEGGGGFLAARALAVGDSGEVYVAGRSGSDFLTVKYDAEGSEAWAAEYHAPYGARDIALDEEGSAYVTGGGHTTVKYSADGSEVWSTPYYDPGRAQTEGRAIAVAGDGSVCVTGTLYWDLTVKNDYATAKYSPSDGAPLWKAQYDGAAQDFGLDVAVDGDGNVLVTGVSLDHCQTVKYDPNGNEIWQVLHPVDESYGHFVAADEAGNVYVAGSAGYDPEFVVLKYDPDGSELWARQYGFVEDGWNELRGFSLGEDGSVCVTGTSGGEGIDNDIATVKYDTDGDELWVARYDGPVGGAGDVALCLSLDDDGNVYVAGDVATAGRQRDYVVLKYDADGNEVWVATCPGPQYDPDIPVRALAVDGAGNVYFTGGSGPSDDEADFLTVKWDSEGEEVWSAEYDGPAGQADYSLHLVLAPDGVVVLGVATARSGLEYVTVKYGLGGAEEWVATRPFPSDLSIGDIAAYAHDLAVDPEGNVYALIGSDASGAGWDYSVVCLDSAGREDWVMMFDGAGDDDVPLALALAPDGSVLVTGASMGAGTYYDFATVRYTRAGVDLPPGEHVAVDGVIKRGDGSALVLLDLSDPADVTMRIYDLHGRLVAVPYDGRGLPAGPNTLTWDLKAEDGSRVVSGTYFCVLDVGDQRTRHRIAVLSE